MSYANTSRPYPFNLVYKLNNIIRYANVSRISYENVAIHSYHVACIVMQLYIEYKFNLEKALTMALSHDIPETEIDDISHATKARFPDVAKALKIAEGSVVDNYPVFMKDAIKDFEQGKSVEAIIVQIADADQCTQYTEYELRHLGNTSSEMEVIYHDSIVRVEKLKRLIADYKR
jgi:5'-deoxynucleotidase YfbR-like HD superfamily hydrolase